MKAYKGFNKDMTCRGFQYEIGNTMTLYATGGGGCLIKNFSNVNADRIKFVDDICAAAKGYEYLAEAHMKSEAKL